MPTARSISLAIAILIGITARSYGQAPAPAPAPAAPLSPVAKLRQEFEAGVLKSTISLNDYYDKRLATLEAELASEGDYAQARLVKLRREEIAAVGKTATNGSGSLNVQLSAETAKLTGALTKGGEIYGWRTATSSAEWVLPRLLPGAYRIELSYSMEGSTSVTPGSSRQPAEEADFVFREVTLLAGASKNVLPLKIASNKGVMTTIQVPGVLQVSRPPFTLRLGCSAYYPLNSISFRDIHLVPVIPTSDAATSAMPAPVVTTAGELQKLKKAQEARLLAIRKPLVTAYVAEIDKLAVKAKDEMADALEAERRRVNKLATSTTPIKGTSTGMDGYDDLSDVHYVADPTNTGDRFKVEHNGEQFVVRLAWVACPPISEDDKHRLKATMDHFGADETVAMYLGSSAKEFTELYLKARPLRLLLRAKQAKAKDEPQAALVFIEDIGLFQNVLIDNGFAIVDPPQNASKGLVEAAMLKSLQDREKAARLHDPPQGGWSMGSKGGTNGK